MNKQAFFAALVAAGFAQDDYNTNNAWGFGGGRGQRFTKGDTVVKVGLAGTRHRGEFPYITVTVGRRRLLDDAPSSKVFAGAIKFLGL